MRAMIRWHRPDVPEVQSAARQRDGSPYPVP
jgi:hypothetical protein